MLSEHGSRLNNASRIEHIDSSVYIIVLSGVGRNLKVGGGGAKPSPVPTPMVSGEKYL